MKGLNYVPTVVVLCTILYLSLTGDVHVPADYSFPYLDKVAHFCMYAGLVSVLYFDLSRTLPTLPSWRKLFIFTWFLPVLYGGIMELLQKYLTATRSAEWEDFLANSAGVTCGMLAGIFLIFPFMKKYRSRKERQ